MRKTNQTPLYLAVVAALSGASAQAVADAALEEVVVVATPIKDSQAAALNIKRLSDNVVDVISADTIGRFPDQNMADSLGRVPGMAIERDQGQARYINFRGTPFRWTAIGFDGIDIPGAENGRIPRFDSFPSSITSQVEINKAVLPSMPGESVAGYVNIKTFNPFDREGLSMDLDVGMGEQDLGGGDVSRESARFSWSSDQFGIMAFSSSNSREQITDNQEPSLMMVNGALELDEVRFASYKIERQDKARGAHVEFRPESTDTRLFASYLYGEFVDLEQRNHFDWSMDSATQIATIKDHLLEYGRYDNSSDVRTLGADFKVQDWSIEARINQTATEFNTFLPIIYRVPVANKTTASYDFSNPTNVKLSLNAPITDSVFYNLVYDVDSPLDIDADTFKFDAEKQFSDMTVKFGAQLSQRQARGFNGTGGSIFGGAPAFPATINPDDYRTNEKWYFNSNNSQNEVYYNNIALRKDWEAAVGSLRLQASSTNEIAIDEDILAAYGMATFDMGWGNIVAGVRVEETDYSSKGTLDGNNITVSDSFTNVLPSVHVNVDLAEDIKGRLSVSTGVNRPTYNEWRASARIDPVNGTVSGGNPTLKAEEAWGVDAAIEYYFANASILSLGAFQRSIDNVIYEDTSTINAGIYGSTFAGQTWDLDGYVNGSDGTLSGVELNFIGQGVDLSESLEGFGVSANVTMLDGDFKRIEGSKAGMPGTSDLMYNVSVFYENYGLSVRVNYQYRDEWISPIEDPAEVWGETERVDLNAMYQLPWDIAGAMATVYFNANNLTDEVDIRYDANHLPNQVESYGSRYLLGLRLSF